MNDHFSRFSGKVFSRFAQASTDIGGEPPLRFYGHNSLRRFRLGAEWHGGDDRACRVHLKFLIGA